MRIKLTHHNQGAHAVGSEHEVDRVVPHGGHTDSAQQYVLADGTHVASDYAEIVPPRPHIALSPEQQAANSRAARRAEADRIEQRRIERARRFTDEGQATWGLR